ncbi:MAG: hypothetical protein J1E34_01475 [Oscillospiraceae bacterium]|nr:hypothetical protein [Oscillospiraceae bacterium]
MIKLKKTAYIILVLSVIISLSSCFTVTVTPGASNAPSSSVSDFVAPSENLPSETQPQESSESAPASDPEHLSEQTSSQPESVSLEESSVSEEASAGVPKTPDNMSSEELLSLFNSVLNSVKDDKVGFKKSKLTSVADLQLSNSAANTLVGFVKNALLSDTADEAVVNNGESGLDVMSPSGKTYVSSLAMSDIALISCVPSGEGYVIRVAVKGETNPADGGSLSRVFDYITVDDVVNIYAPKVGATVAKDDIEVVFSNCTATLNLNSDGTVKSYSTYVECVMNMYNASIKKVVTINTDLAITLSSTTNYTDFTY